MLSDKPYASSFEEAHESYQLWKAQDPYPDVPPALLNSADIMDYVRVTGMIYPFREEDVIGATYSVRLKGLCVYFEEEIDGKITKNCFRVGEDDLHLPNAEENQHQYETVVDKVVLKPNSITFVTLEPVLQVPEYLVFRFNLKISHVYKGILLGTGPIIDPGFQGRLSLPLHNLTSNEYVLNVGDEVISLEVTKMSPTNRWRAHYKVRNRWADYIPTNIRAHRQVDEYLRSALRGNSRTYVVSSISAATGKAMRIANSAKERVRKLKNWLRGIAIVGTIAVTVAIITLVVNLLVPTYQLVKEVTDTQAGYETRIEQLEEELIELQELLQKYGIEKETS